MKPYHGPGRDEERSEQLLPGVHRVALKSWRRLDNGNYLCILANKHGEVGEFVPEDITPYTREERERIRHQSGRAPDGWKFWRLIGGFDYPSSAYWAAEEKEARTWDVETALTEIVRTGNEAWVRTGEWLGTKSNKVKAQVEAIKSLTRHAEEIMLQGDPGPGGSKLAPPPAPVAAGGGYKDEEVPF